jgi:DNA-binding MarR family transcriptional regulator
LAAIRTEPCRTMTTADLPDSLRDSTGFLLGRAAAMARADFAGRLQALGLNAKHYTVLSFVAAREALSQQAIGEALALDRTTMVQLIDALERAGAVQRTQDPSNRRAWLILMTPDGRRLLRRLERLAAASDRAIEACLGADDARALRRLLVRLLTPSPACARAAS